MKILVFTMLTAFLLPYSPEVSEPFIIVNKSINQLALFDDGKLEEVYPVASGATEELTPTGLFTITVKAKDPYYRKKDIPGGNANNPLGTRWVGFDAEGTDGRIFGVHGTNQPDSVGKYVSNGCIRMYNKQVESLYERVPTGSKILVVDTGKSFKDLYENYLQEQVQNKFNY
ncbi:L,D-transpeptidase [Thalassobacillus pellis]|uniref:L,D-transpeptidase n=1 Tax=Thalassobacillus pellis TaxID=748008 RepID=UPI001961E928|nr:L,D-transpeptidase [Thalassobacillus pellis]MBM7552366.1 lipoprotein-anchoring transpeptidase ErfK/SrfK [Thalassobacillus pellis]